MSNSKKTEAEDIARLLALRGVSGTEHPPAPDLEARDDLPKGRSAMKGVVVYLNVAAKATLQRIADRERRTLNDLGCEAINLLFANRGEKPIA